MTSQVGLHPEDLATVMAQFGVSEEQVRRDHVISHILAALSRHHRDEIIFFGGTALSRTHLVDERLSEDVDLIAIDHRDDLANVLISEIDMALQRTHGRLSWTPGWSPNADMDPAVVITPDGIATRIQLLRGEHYELWPTEMRVIEQRYRDAPPATLRVPTLASFAGLKMAAWVDRGAARDLYDLWALDEVGALDAESAALFASHGPTSGRPRSWMFKHSPSAEQWQSQLGGQTRLTVSAAEALEVVRASWEAVVGEDF